MSHMLYIPSGVCLTSLSMVMILNQNPLSKGTQPWELDVNVKLWKKWQSQTSRQSGTLCWPLSPLQMLLLEPFSVTRGTKLWQCLSVGAHVRLMGMVPGSSRVRGVMLSWAWSMLDGEEALEHSESPIAGSLWLDVAWFPRSD